MDLIKELGITLIVGAFTILGFELIFFILFGFDLTGYIREVFTLIKKKVKERSLIISSIPPNNTNIPDSCYEGSHSNNNSPITLHYTRMVVFVCLSFGIGILAEDLSYKFVDSKLPFGLPTRYDTRIQTLIGDIEKPEIEPLAKELAINNMFIQIDNECGETTQQWILASDEIKRSEIKICTKYQNINDQITSQIKRLYYISKNNVYLQGNYYDELKKIQSRSDFTRSIAVISFVYFSLTTIIIIIIIISEVCKKITGKRQSLLKNIWFKIKVPMLVASVLIVIIGFSAWAFYRESFEFNKRVFGYYSTIMFNEKQKISQSGESRCPDLKPPSKDK